MKRSTQPRKVLKNTIESSESTLLEDPAIFKLNDDCMRHIISFLSIKERLRLKRVCKKWQALIELPWDDIRELKVSFGNSDAKQGIKYTPSILRKVLGYCGKFVHSLTLGDSYCESGFNKSVMTSITKKCPNLKSLNMYGMNLICSAAEVLAESFSNLNSISIGNCEKGCTKAVVKLLSNNKQLKSVEFHGCDELNARCLSALPAKSIESLTFGEDCGFSSRDVMKLLGNSIKLRSLCIESNDELKNNLNDLLSSLANKSCLESLVVYPEYGDTDFVSIPNICHCTNLRKLGLPNCVVNDQLLANIAENCKHLKSVTFSAPPGIYSVDNHVLTDSGLNRLLDSGNIEELSLNHFFGITDNVFASTTMPSLKTFECSFMPQLTNNSFVQLMHASSNLSSLRIKDREIFSSDSLINDAFNYISNRSGGGVLKIHLTASNLTPSLHRISPRLIVEIKKLEWYEENSDSDSD